jgi:hypothetical protein
MELEKLDPSFIRRSEFDLKFGKVLGEADDTITRVVDPISKWLENAIIYPKDVTEETLPYFADISDRTDTNVLITGMTMHLGVNLVFIEKKINMASGAIISGYDFVGDIESDVPFKVFLKPQDGSVLHLNSENRLPPWLPVLVAESVLDGDKHVVKRLIPIRVSGGKNFEIRCGEVPPGSYLSYKSYLASADRPYGLTIGYYGDGYILLDCEEMSQILFIDTMGGHVYSFTYDELCVNVEK